MALFEALSVFSLAGLCDCARPNHHRAETSEGMVTQTEALQEARRRWGAKAVVWVKRGCALRWVGTKGYRNRVVRGVADSWEAAFADASRRACIAMDEDAERENEANRLLGFESEILGADWDADSKERA